MVALVPVDPSKLQTTREGRRGRVSYPLIKMFLESNQKLSKIDMQGLDKNPAYLRSVLYSYINNHDLPVKVFSMGGDLHLMRLDIENDGTPIPDWRVRNERTTEGAAGHLRDLAPTPINAQEVEARFQEEKHKSTK